MAFKFIAIAAQLFLVQAVFGQCINSASLLGNIGYQNIQGSLGSTGVSNCGANIGNLQSIGGFNQGYGGSTSSSSSGGAFPVVFSSPISPTGLSAYSENSIEGVLLVNGNLPFASAVALEGSLPSNGQAGVSYGCGNEVSLSSAGNGVGIGGGNGGIGAGFGINGAGITGYGNLGLQGANYNIAAGRGCGCQ